VKTIEETDLILKSSAKSTSVVFIQRVYASF
jgi:hypothetical protein